MNKHQEALNFLDWHCEVSHVEQQDLLQKLVDKETPMKPKRNLLLCPTCNSDIGVALDYSGEVISKDNYCCECGQKIDWSDDDE